MKYIFFILGIIFASATIASATQTHPPDGSTGNGISNGGAPCTTDAECNAPNGNCVTGSGFDAPASGICVCSEKYTDPFCSYEMKSKGIAAGLQLLFIIGLGGIGNFYIGRIGEAVGQLILCLGFGCITFICITCNTRIFDHDERGWIAMFGLTILCMLVGMIWSFVDMGLMVNDKFVDGNNYPLYPIDA
jgi:TM2 domain-containing membrane protein YozV